MKCILITVLLFLSVPWLCAEDRPQKCATQYEDHNQVDYGPIVLRQVSGIAIDPSAVEMPGGCIQLFTDKGHELIAVTVSDQQGRFAFANLAPGRYRLVARFDGLCAANVPIKVVGWPRSGKRNLVLHMRGRGIDDCSYGAYK